MHTTTTILYCVYAYKSTRHTHTHIRTLAAVAAMRATPARHRAQFSRSTPHDRTRRVRSTFEQFNNATRLGRDRDRSLVSNIARVVCVCVSLTIVCWRRATQRSFAGG